MNCAEFKEAVGGLALGALEPAEEIACADHLETDPVHQGCHEAYARALVTAGKLATALAPVKPDPRVWTGIEAALDGESRTSRPGPRRWTGAVGWAVAAAAAIALVYIWVDRDRTRTNLVLAQGQVAEAVKLTGAAQQRQGELEEELKALRKELQDAQGGDRLREAVALKDLPDTQQIPMEGKGFHATLYYNPREHRAYVVAPDLDATAARDFQLWVVRKGAKGPIPAGLMRRKAGQDSVGEVDPGVLGGEGVQAIAMSLEARGGSINGKPATVLMVGAVKS